MTTLATLQNMKTRGEKIAVLTCYDASFAVLCEAAGMDVLLVGDSLGMVLQGESDTLGDHAGYGIPHPLRGAVCEIRADPGGHAIPE